METKDVLNLISCIPIGTIAAWVIVISSIIAAICTCAIKLYKIFSKYKRVKDIEENQREMIESHERTLKEISSVLEKIQSSLDEQKDVNLKQIRHTIVNTCEDAMERGEISIDRLRSLEEMFDEYTCVFHGNGYVKTLVNRVRDLNIVGMIED